MTSSPANKSDADRKDFVKEMYRVYWANIARSMEGVWKVLGPITVAGTILAGVHKDYLPAPLGIALAFVVTLWALNVTIDLNAWHRRNLFFVARAEQEFLADKDYGRLLPAAFRRPSTGWITFYSINVATFVAFLLLSGLYAAIWKLRDVGLVEGWLLPFIVLVGGAIATVVNVWTQEGAARSHSDELFGKAATPGTRDSEAPMQSNVKKAVVLLSGGLDSTTSLAIAREQGFECYAITFDYGQRHRFEIEAARRIAEAYAAKGHVVVNMDLRVFGNSALTTNIDVPKNRSAQEIGKGIPITYVPARNTIFLSFALAYAETVGAEDIFIGVNALDYSGYPDSRPEFIEAYQKMATLATKAGVEGRQKVTIHTPLITLTKAEIIRKGIELGVDYSLTSSCYDPSADGKASGDCDSCTLRRKGFKEAGIVDPTRYVIVK